MDPISRLTEYFREFPGIGPRQAKRFVYFLLTRNASYLDDISRLILEVKKSVHVCPSCFRFFQGSTSGPCPICSNRERKSDQLLVVSRDVDFEAIEKSKFYTGYYFILGGTIPILDSEPEKRVRIKELKDRITKSKPTEVILSLNVNAEGENTSIYLKSIISAIDSNIKITVLGRGLSTGSELEYSDSDTIKNALKNRESI
jgi:recombination protein RecR